MSMIVPHFSPEGQKSNARQNESLLDKVLAAIGEKIPAPAERLQDVLKLFEESVSPQHLSDLRDLYAPQT